MYCYRIILIVICIMQTGVVFAQWTKEDSVWMQDVTSGKVKVKLDPEVQKAIDEGTFIIIGPSDNQPSSASPTLPIDKSFEGIKPEQHDENSRLPFDFTQFPPSVFMLMDIDSILPKSLVIVPSRIPAIEMKVIPLGKSRFYIVGNTRNSPITIKDGIRSNAVSTGIGMSFSLDEILCQIFSPSERAKKRNRKHATAWKYYYNAY